MANRFETIFAKARAEQRTLIMGIVNATPDSFSDGGEFLNPQAAATHAQELVAQGADVIDLGAESTRPGSRKINEDEEMARLLPALKAIRQALPDVPVSVDTYHARVAEQALAAGADILNDVCAIFSVSKMRERDYEMARLAATTGAPLIAIHNRFGDENYGEDFMSELLNDLRAGVEIILKAGVPAEKIWLDPGFCFGKSLEQNLQIVTKMREIVALGFPVLLGTSRKSALGKILAGKPPKERGGADAACATLGIAGGAAMLRVHDVAAIRDVAITADALMRVK